MNAKYADLFQEELQEGQIYIVNNFIVQKYSGMESHRCIRYDTHIYFADYTKLEKTMNEGLTIPQYSFDIFNLKDLDKIEQSKSYLCGKNLLFIY